MRFTTDGSSLALLARRAQLRDDVTAALAGLGDDLAGNADREGALQSVVDWLAMYWVTGDWRPKTPDLPDGLADELRALDEEPTEGRAGDGGQ